MGPNRGSYPYTNSSICQRNEYPYRQTEDRIGTPSSRCEDTGADQFSGKSVELETFEGYGFNRNASIIKEPPRIVMETGRPDWTEGGGNAQACRKVRARWSYERARKGMEGNPDLANKGNRRETGARGKQETTWASPGAPQHLTR